MGNGQSGAGKKVTTIRIIAKIITPDRPSPDSQDCKTSIHSRSGSRNQPRHSTSKSKLTAAHGHQRRLSFAAWPGGPLAAMGLVKSTDCAIKKEVSLRCLSTCQLDTHLLA